MPFDPNSAKKAGKKSKRGPVKKEEPSIKEKMELLYEKVLDDLLINQEKLTKTERVKLFVTLFGFDVPIVSVSTSEYFQQAKRPIYSLLDNSKIKNTFDINQMNYLDSLNKCIKILQHES